MTPTSDTSGRYLDDHADSRERTYSTFTHLVGLLGIFDMMFIGLIGTIIMWRIKADDSPFLDDHGREATNFQISLLIYTLVGGIVLGIFTAITLGIGVILAIPVGVLGIVFMAILRLVGGIRGALAANRGEYYRYPMTIRFIADPAG